MKIGIICVTHRPASQSGRSRHIENVLLAEGVCAPRGSMTWAAIHCLLWDETIWEGDEQWRQILAPLSAELKSCDGFVVVSPEWHGMAPAGLKTFS
ncbi:MAG: NAD(P)H-dependent oxidoreductase [Halioglobus sp.]